MHLRKLVCDLNGTLMENDRTALETWEALYGILCERCRFYADAGWQLAAAWRRSMPKGRLLMCARRRVELGISEENDDGRDLSQDLGAAGWLCAG
jgi:hypothetical protein